MNHRMGFNKLGMMAAHRRAMLKNMMTSLFKHERIYTTIARAKELRRFAEKEITRAKVDSVHNRRMVARKIKDEAILAKLFKDIGPRFKDRNGGYTRILRIENRKNDAAMVCLIELVDYKLDIKLAADEKKAAKKQEKTKAAAAAK